MTDFEKIETVKLYNNDSYEKEFTALVRLCSQSGDFFEIELDRTAFFPESGGQPGDVGVLHICAENGVETVVHVLDTKICDGIVSHLTDGPLPVGARVFGEIDREKRFSRMQNHSAEHIVSGLAYSMFGFHNIGFHLTDEYVTCDYNGTFSWDDLKRLEYEANKAVFENIPITAWFPSAEELKSIPFRSKMDFSEEDFENGNVRIVRIGDVDCCACCAPHVKSTGEIGLIKIVDFEKSHGGTRLHLRAGFLALKDYDEKQTNILRIIDLLSARQFETADYVESLQKANSRLAYELKQTSKKLGKVMLDAMESGVEGNLVVTLAGADSEALRTIADGGREMCSGVFVALTECDGGFSYVITTNNTEISLRSLVREYNVALNGRGGGKDEMISGVFAADLETIKEYFE